LTGEVGAFPIYGTVGCELMLAGGGMEKVEAAKDIETGDQVQLETGEWVTVIRVGESKSPGSTILVDWEGRAGGGSSRLFPDEHVHLQRRRQG
jgi:hypothetical protein